MNQSITIERRRWKKKKKKKGDVEGLALNLYFAVQGRTE
jgi:hypothetical protein